LFYFYIYIYIYIYIYRHTPPRNRRLISRHNDEISLLRSVHALSRAYPALLLSGYWGIFSRGHGPGLPPTSSVETENGWSHASTFLRFNCVHRDDIRSKKTFPVVLKTHTPHYLRTTFRKLLLSSSGENMVS
jgi:hypothetical protein